MIRFFTLLSFFVAHSWLLFSQTSEFQVVYNHEMTPAEALRKGTIGTKFITTPPPSGIIRNIAEFEKMEGALIRYPLGITTSLVSALSQITKVWTVVDSIPSYNAALNSFTNGGVNMSNIIWVNAPSDRYWTRDYGPWFIHYGNHELGIVDFPYNRPDRPLDDSIPKVIASKMNLPWFGMPLIHTGGNYMTLGTGVSASSDLVITENPNYTVSQIDSIVYHYLGVTTYHKVPDPNNTYIDHIDCWGKYLAPDKVLIRSVPPTHPQYSAIEATASYFAGQTSPYGTPFKLFRVYTPNNQPYTNSLILNDHVFVPVMGNVQYDTAALHVYEQALPGYTIQGFTGTWQSTDALHCRVIGLADRSMLEILHSPVVGPQPTLPQYDLIAEIYPFSGIGLYQDSVILHYKVDNGPYLTCWMSYTGNNQWTASIPGQPNGTVVRYYLSAADSAGNTATHPYIGQADPHVFTVGNVGISDMNGIHEPAGGILVSPNPFKTICTIEFELKEITSVSLDLYDIQGRLIQTLIRQPLGVGRHYFCWDGTNFQGKPVSPGSYLVTFTTNGIPQVKKLIYQGN